MKFPGTTCWLMVAAMGVCMPAAAKADSDPIGAIRPASRFDGGHGVMLGRDAAGRTVCYVREQGDTHQLDVGIGTQGAFVRLETPEPRDATARNPVRVFAGLQQVDKGKATDRFMSLKSFAGTPAFHVPREDLLGFVIVADGDPAAFLEVVAAARRNFLVIESRQPPVTREYVGIGDFDSPTAQALAACARRHLR